MNIKGAMYKVEIKRIFFEGKVRKLILRDIEWCDGRVKV